MTSSTNVRDELLDVSDNLSVCLSKLSKLANQINTRKTSTEDQSSPDNDDKDDGKQNYSYIYFDNFINYKQCFI